MAAVRESGDGGSNVAVVAMFLIALILILAILVYGFTVAHWFGGGGTIHVVTYGGSGAGGATAAPSISPGK